MIDNLVSRAEILIQQRRYDEAEKILKDLLATAPNNLLVLVLLAEVYIQKDQYKEADTIIDAAIGMSPDNPHLFYTKARICIQQDQYKEAEKYLQQAVAIEPNEADFYSLWASVKLTRKQYQEALEMADKSLELDSENVLGLNMRSTALVKLNKKEDSFLTIEGALRNDPNNAYTHANYGWNLLEKGDHKKALEHFKESLKNEPNFEYAQAGMAEALKAKYFVYRQFLKYSFWMSNLSGKYQWGVIIGFYFGVKGLRYLADSNESLQPFLFPLIMLLTIFALSTWVLNPILNLFLRFNPYGKYLLTKKEKMSSNFVAASFGVFVLGLLGLLFTGNLLFLAITVFGFAMMVPLSVMFSPTKYKHVLVIYAALMALVGIAAIYTTFSTGQLFNQFTPIFIIGFFIFQWVANFMIIRESNT